MSAEEFANIVHDIFNYSVATDDGLVSDDESPLDELFGGDVPEAGVAVEWTGNPSEDIPDIEPLLNLADREGMRLADREMAFSEGGQTRRGYEDPSMKERLVFVERE